MIKRFFISIFTFILMLSLIALAFMRPVRGEADKICFSALEQLGAVYEYAVCEPGRAFDCSSFTSYIYGLHGVSLPPDAKGTGYLKAGERIEDKSLLRRGDVVCFDTVEDDDKSDHVGIYLGRGAFIHASSERGHVVISLLAEYDGVYSWGVRVMDGE